MYIYLYCFFITTEFELQESHIDGNILWQGNKKSCILTKCMWNGQSIKFENEQGFVIANKKYMGCHKGKRTHKLISERTFKRAVSAFSLIVVLTFY